jgi:ribosomal protein L7/L12
MIAETKKSLSDEQIRNVELLVEKVMDLNESQFRYNEMLIREKLVKNNRMTHLYLNTDWSKLVNQKKPQPINPEYFKQQEFMSEFTKWLSTQKPVDLGFGPAAGAVSPGASAAAEKKEEKVEEKKEKPVVDIELTSYDAAKKIALIKEVRAALNLGLKEAKEAVEKAPAIMFKGVKREDVEAMTKKLVENGAVITLK